MENRERTNIFFKILNSVDSKWVLSDAFENNYRLTCLFAHLGHNITLCCYGFFRIFIIENKMKPRRPKTRHHYPIQYSLNFKSTISAQIKGHYRYFEGKLIILGY